MSRAEMYPWSTMLEVGDYFMVLDEFKPYSYMNAVVSQRNSTMRGKVKYSCTKTTYGCIIFVAQVGEDVARYDFEPLPGVFAGAPRLGDSSEGLQTQGDRPKVRELTQQEKINRMSVDQKIANLPWWHDPKTGQLVWNSKVATEEDTDRWFNKTFSPGPEVRYPDYYHLDENLQRKTRDQVMAEEEEEEEDWGEHPTHSDGDGEEN